MTASIQAEPGRRADGPEPTRQERIEQHVHLVHRAARRVLGVLPAHVDDAEVIGYGILGLLEALDRDGETEGPAFEAAASRTIWQRIVEALSEMDWLGAAGRERVRTLVRAHSELAAELGRPATEEELASHLAVAADQLCEWLEQASRVFATSLDQFVWIEGEDGSRWAASLAQSRDGDGGPEWQALEHALAHAISRLPQEDRLLVALYYYEELSLSEIAQVLDITQRRAAQIHGRAGLRLRSLLAAECGDAASPA